MAGVPEIVGAWFSGSVDVIENVGSELVLAPSVTEMPMPEYVAAVPEGGVPLNRPVLALNPAPAGLLATANVSAWPSGSDAASRWQVA